MYHDVRPDATPQYRCNRYCLRFLSEMSVWSKAIGLALRCCVRHNVLTTRLFVLPASFVNIIFAVRYEKTSNVFKKSKFKFRYLTFFSRIPILVSDSVELDGNGKSNHQQLRWGDRWEKAPSFQVSPLLSISQIPSFVITSWDTLRSSINF